jgi:hypothetical protein
MNCGVYLRNGILYLPTMGKMEEGFYRGVEPVAVVPVSNTAEAGEALQTMISRGNPIVPMLRRREIPPPVLLKYAGVKRWSEFERGMQFWTIDEKDGCFRIAGQRKHQDRGWRDDTEQIVSFPPGTEVGEIIDRFIAILQNAGLSR